MVPNFELPNPYETPKCVTEVTNELDVFRPSRDGILLGVLVLLGVAVKVYMSETLGNLSATTILPLLSTTSCGALAGMGCWLVIPIINGKSWRTLMPGHW